MRVSFQLGLDTTNSAIVLVIYGHLLLRFSLIPEAWFEIGVSAAPLREIRGCIFSFLLGPIAFRIVAAKNWLSIQEAK